MKPAGGVQVSLTSVPDTARRLGRVLCNRWTGEDKRRGGDGAFPPVPQQRAIPYRGRMSSQRGIEAVRHRWRVVALAAGALILGCAGIAAAGDGAVGPKSGLPLPRFVSLKPDRVNVRGGPTRDYEVTFVYTRAGLPVEVTAESDNWRRIRDWEGSEGWVYHSLLSGRRTVLVAPKDKKALVPLFDREGGHGTLVAQLQAGVMAQAKRCTGSWCHLAGTGFDGWAAQEQLWGVYPDEKVD
jgi:SH3-like domain-containing protein